MNFTLFLIALISHVLGDFVFQPDKIVKGREAICLKNTKGYILSARYNLIHAFIHTIIFLILVFIVNYTSLLDLSNYLLSAIFILCIHFVIDYGKCFYKCNVDKLPYKLSNLCLFILDQIFHFIALYIIFIVFKNISFYEFLEYINFLKGKLVPYNNFLAICFILLFCTYEVGYFLKFLLNTITRSNYEEDEGAKNGGFIIGVLERIFIIISVVCTQYALIAVILTLKSIARFKKFSEDYFVECFIIGTLVSLVTAYIAGLLIYKLI